MHSETGAFRTPGCRKPPRPTPRKTRSLPDATVALAVTVDVPAGLDVTAPLAGELALVEGLGPGGDYRITPAKADTAGDHA